MGSGASDRGDDEAEPGNGRVGAEAAAAIREGPGVVRSGRHAPELRDGHGYRELVGTGTGSKRKEGKEESKEGSRDG